MKISIAAVALVIALPMSVMAQTSESSPTSASPQAAGVKITQLAKLDNPWGMAFLPDGRLLVTEKPGRLRIYANGKLSDPVEGVPAVEYLEQGGLLDVAVDPDFAKTPWVYLSYTEAAAEQPAGATDPGDPRFGPGPFTDVVLKGGAVARGKLSGNRLTDVEVIWRQIPKTIGRGHFGNRLVFAPDGTLYITSGERMRFDPAQDLASNLGKVVRINRDGSIPESNPFANRAGAQGDIWSIGHRNILSAAFNPATKQLWLVEMGPLGGDELNISKRARNYGWPIVSNGDNYDNSPIPDHPTRPEFEAPIRNWTPVIAPSGLVFYSGKMFRKWKGNALIGGLKTKALIRLTLKGDEVTGEHRIDMQKRIRDVIQAPDGAVLLLTDGNDGELLRLTRAN